MNRSKTVQNISEKNSIQRHVSFWDKKNRGYITPVDIIFGFISLGYGILTSIVLGAFIAVVLSVTLQISCLPDIFFRFSASALIISRQQLSGVFDKNGILVPQKFEILFKRHAKFGDRISMMELFWLTKEQEQLGFSLKAWIVAIMEIFTAYFFVGQNGFISKQDLQDLYNGKLFFKMENKNSCQPKVLDFIYALPSRIELFKSQMLNAFNLKSYYDSWENSTKSCNSSPIKNSHDNIQSKHRALDGLSEKESNEKKFLATVIEPSCEEQCLPHDLLKKVSHSDDITVEKALRTSSQNLAIVRIETAVVLHSSNYLLSYEEPLSLVSDATPCDLSICHETSPLKVEIAVVLQSPDVLLALDGCSEKEPKEKTFLATVIEPSCEEPGFVHGLLKEESHSHDITVVKPSCEEHSISHGLLKKESHSDDVNVEKAFRTSSQNMAVVRIETAVVLHSSNYLLSYEEPLSLVSDASPCDISVCHETSPLKVETAAALQSSNVLLAFDDSSIAASCDDFTCNSPNYCDGLEFYSDSDYCGISDYCDVSGFSDSSASSDNLSSCDTLSSCNDSSLSDMCSIQPTVSIDCSSRPVSLLGISNMLTRDDSPKISEPIYALPKKTAIQLFCEGWYKKPRTTRKGKKTIRAL